MNVIVFLPKMHNLKAIMRMYQKLPNGGILYKIVGQDSSIRSRLEKKKKKNLRNSFPKEETK